MARPKYKVKYCDEVVEYFSRFLEMRDDPDAQGASEEVRVKSEEGGTPHQSVHATGEQVTSPPTLSVLTASPPGEAYGKPCSGYPSLIKFARKIGVTPRTLTNWRQRYPQFDEACEFADMIQDEVLNERGLAGTVDGRVAMKIRELKMSAKRDTDCKGGGLGGLKIEIHKHISDNDGLVLKEWKGDVIEDTEYTSEN